MRVNQPGTNSVQGNEASSARHTARTAGASDAKRAEKSSTAEVEKKVSPGVNTEISQKSKELANAKSIASETPDVREDRVADLKKKISEGSYQVDSEAVADRLVDDHMRMSGIG